MMEDALCEASGMAQGTRRRSPRRSKLAERFERAGYTLEETEYEVLSPRGKNFDLRRVLQRVDRAFFGADRPFELPTVGWAPLDGHNAWAMYVLKDDRILLDKALDDAFTPPFVIEYLLLHELLHLAHAPSEEGPEPEWHTEGFEAHIAKFPQAAKAEQWLDDTAQEQVRQSRGRGASTSSGA
jgi:hypothetical protein